MMLGNAALNSIHYYLNKATDEEIKNQNEEVVIEQFLENEDSSFSLTKITE
jgi:hypothetical protein